MANERLYQFPPKTTPVPADILFLGDSADGWNESSSTIAQVISAYPNLSSLAQLTLVANTFPYIGNSGNWASGTLTTLALTLLADATIANVLNTLTLPIGLTTPTGTGNGVLDTSPTINTPTLTNPTVSTGTFTSPTINTPTISNPTVTDGSFTNAILYTPVIDQGTQAQPILEQPHILGVVTTTLASAGEVGEIIQSVRSFASQVGMADNEVAPIAQISLTPGDWDIWGNVTFSTTSASNCSYQAVWLSTNSSVTADNSITNQLSASSYVLTTNGLSAPQLTMQFSTTTTVYLMALANFSTSTLGCCGGIYARRRR